MSSMPSPLSALNSLSMTSQYGMNGGGGGGSGAIGAGGPAGVLVPNANDALQYDHLVSQAHHHHHHHHQHPFSNGFQPFSGQNFTNSVHSFHQGKSSRIYKNVC